MSYEQALIAQALPRYVAHRASTILEYEVCKGCSGQLYREPVALEPRFEAVGGWSGGAVPGDLVPALKETPPPAGELCRFQILLAAKEKVDTHRSERFLKQLQGLRHRAAFEIRGNREFIRLELLVHRVDAPLVQVAFHGEFPALELVPLERRDEPVGNGAPVRLRDFYPPPPYTHLLTRLTELRYSPYDAFFAALESLEPPEVALLQVLFQPVFREHDYHRNVAVLLDIEYAMKLQTSPQSSARPGQQSPANELHQMASELETKAHDDKPFFATALRLLATDSENGGNLTALSAFSGLFQHGGRPLNHIGERDYAPLVDGPGLCEVVGRGLTLRPGFLLNSWELAGLCHLPPPETIERHAARFSTLPLAPGSRKPAAIGTVLGLSTCTGIVTPVRMPEHLECRNTHIIGNNGTGKTSLLEDMALQDIGQGHGVILIDPHGDLAERLLGLIQEGHADRTIYFDPGHPGWVPLWNPLLLTDGQDSGRVADGLVGALKSVMDGWGDRLGHLLRNTFSALLEVPEATLFDATELLRKDSAQGKDMRKRILATVRNEHTRRFWIDQFPRYTNADLAPPQHKLGQLFASLPVARMLAQPTSAIDLHRIVNDQQILLVNLSNLASDTRNVFGAFLLSLIHMVALERSNCPPEQRKPVSVYCDEAHRITTDALEDLLNEGRKFNVRFHLAHHQMSQMTAQKADALASAGTTVAFRLGAKDAGLIARGFMGKVEPTDIMALPDHEAVARIGTEVVSFRTREPQSELRADLRKRILKNSRERYYVPLDEAKKNSGRRSCGLSEHLGSAPEGKEEDYGYDEF